MQRKSYEVGVSEVLRKYFSIFIIVGFAVFWAGQYFFPQTEFEVINISSEDVCVKVIVDAETIVLGSDEVFETNRYVTNDGYIRWNFCDQLEGDGWIGASYYTSRSRLRQIVVITNEGANSFAQ